MKASTKKQYKPGLLATPNDSSAARGAEWKEAVARSRATLGDRVAGVDYRRHIMTVGPDFVTPVESIPEVITGESEE